MSYLYTEQSWLHAPEWPCGKAWFGRGVVRARTGGYGDPSSFCRGSNAIVHSLIISSLTSTYTCTSLAWHLNIVYDVDELARAH